MHGVKGKQAQARGRLGGREGGAEEGLQGAGQAPPIEWEVRAAAPERSGNFYLEPPRVGGSGQDRHAAPSS